MKKIKIVRLLLLFILCCFHLLPSHGGTLNDSTNIQDKILKKKISFSCKKLKIKKILLEFNEKEGLNFAYSGSLPSLEIERQTNFSGVELSHVLSNIFKGTEISYVVVDDFIILTENSILDSVNIKGPKYLAKDNHIQRDSLKYRKVILKDIKDVDRKRKNIKNYTFYLSSKTGHLSNSFKGKSFKVGRDTLPAPDTSIQSFTKSDSLKNLHVKEKEKINKSNKLRNITQIPRSSFGISFEAGLAYWNMEVNRQELVTSISDRNAYGSPDPVSGLAINYRFAITRHLFSETGLEYLRLTRKGTHIDYYSYFGNNNSVTSKASTYQDMFQYVAIPLFLGVNTKPGKLIISFVAGGNFGFLVGSKTADRYDLFKTMYPKMNEDEKPDVPYPLQSFRPPYSDQMYNDDFPRNPGNDRNIFSYWNYINQFHNEVQADKAPSSLRKINYQLIIRAEVNFEISRKVRWLFIPTFRYFVDPIFKDNAPVNENVFSIGMSTGLQISI